MERIKNEEGFTFIEIVGVLVIVSIISAVAITKFFDLQGRARGRVIQQAMVSLETRVNSHFCSNLLDGTSPINITYKKDEVGVYLSKDFEVTNWDYESDPSYIKLDITYYPNPKDHTQNPVVKKGLVLPKPLYV